MKNLIVIITETAVRSETKAEIVSIISTPINCSSNDERDIRHAIASSRNTAVLLNIICRDLSKKEIAEIKPRLDEVAESLKNAESVKVLFINCANGCENCIMHQLHQKVEQKHLLNSCHLN